MLQLLHFCAIGQHCWLFMIPISSFKQYSSLEPLYLREPPVHLPRNHVRAEFLYINQPDSCNNVYSRNPRIPAAGLLSFGRPHRDIGAVDVNHIPPMWSRLFRTPRPWWPQPHCPNPFQKLLTLELNIHARWRGVRILSGGLAVREARMHKPGIHPGPFATPLSLLTCITSVLQREVYITCSGLLPPRLYSVLVFTAFSKKS